MTLNLAISSEPTFDRRQSMVAAAVAFPVTFAFATSLIIRRADWRGTNTIVFLGLVFALAAVGLIADLIVQLNKRRHDVMPATIEEK